MVTTSNQQDGAQSSPPDPSPQPQQPPIVADNSSSQESQSPPTEPSTEAVSPLRHPAPLPEEPPQTSNSGNLKRPPPKLMIKIYKVTVGAVVSWHALLTPNHEEIAKYQLYSYQEGTQPPSTSLWKKLGDIDPLPLPMACTLSQFSAGYTYHFAIRAVDVLGRCGKFSESLSMYMEEDKIADELLMKREEGAARARVESREGAAAGATVPIKKEPHSNESIEDEGNKSGAAGGTQEGEKSEAQAGGNVSPKDVENGVECVKEAEKDVTLVKEGDKEQDKTKVQDKEMVQVKEEKDRSSCSC